MLRKCLPRLYLGTMTFAWKQASSFVDDAAALSFLTTFIAAGGTHVDTARIYAGGDTEPMLGRAIAQLDRSTRSKLLVGSKAHPSEPGGLGQDGLHAQLGASLEAVGTSSTYTNVSIRLCMTVPEDSRFRSSARTLKSRHAADTEHTLLESLRAADVMVRENLVGAVGMSNYHSDEVARAYALCEKHGLTKPSLYQGLYNPLNRNVEEALMPTLRANNCSFVAFNPLAAGLLAGVHRATGADQAPAGRFRDNPNYLPRFYTEANFDALEQMQQACATHGWPLLDATYCWLLRQRQ